MNKIYPFLILTAFILFACDKEETITPSINSPEFYSFERSGQTTVSFDGQTSRIGMASELGVNMSDLSITEDLLLQLYRNETSSGGDANPYTDPVLNTSTKNVKEKVAASNNYFSSNTVESANIKNQFEVWMFNQVNEVFSNQNTLAVPGTAGQIADGTRTRYISEQGIEYDQLVKKGLLGALMTDQILNNYLSTEVLDAANNLTNNTNGILEVDENYTTMEHYWDEAYGYLYGKSVDPANPNLTIGEDDDFLNEYIGVVNNDPDFAGIADDIFNAFKLGRAAIVAKQYDIRDAQAEIIRAEISKVIAIRAVYYLQGGKNSLPTNRTDYSLYGTSLHELSEGYGFVYSLRFTREPNTNQPHFTKDEVDQFLNDILSGGNNGLWDVDAATLDQLSETIALKFGFTVDQAAS
jgi:hypothetical protein